MKKTLILIAFLFCAVLSFAQYPNSQSVSNTLTIYHAKGALKGDSAFMLPVNDTLNNLATPYYGAVTVLPSDVLKDTIPIWMSNGHHWIRFQGSTGAFNINDTIYTRLPIYVDTISNPGKRVIAFLQADGLISGGVVTIDSCMTIDVTAPTFLINYKQYVGLATFGIVITPSNVLPRIDRVVIDTNLLITVIAGTPSATPIAPPYNSFSQISLAEIPVGAGVTCLGTQEIIYDGVADFAGQWTITTAGTGSTSFTNTANPYHLTQASYTVTYSNGYQIIYTKPSGTDTVKATSVLKGFITLIGGLTAPNQISGQWYNGTTAVSSPLLLNAYFNPNDSNVYQMFVVPLNAWSWPGGSVFNKLVLTFGGNDNSGAKGVYLDWIQLQTGIGNVATSLQLTTNGTSGPATLISNVLNIPIYSGQGGGGSILDTSFNWSVIDSLSTPAVLPNEGSIFLVGTSPTGAFVGHANNIATIDSVANIYSFDTASIGDLLYNAATGFVSQLIGGSWVRIGRAVIHQGGDNYNASIVVGSNDSKFLILETKNTPRVYIDTLGRVGIGKSTPTVTLDVVGDGTFTGTVRASNYYVTTNGNGTNAAGNGIGITNYGANAVPSAFTYSLLNVYNTPGTTRNLVTIGNPGFASSAFASGTNVVNWLNIDAKLNNIGGTNISRGIYYNPTLTSIIGTKEIAMENVSGEVMMGTSGSGGLSVGANLLRDTSALVDISSTKQGMLAPRMTAVQRNKIIGGISGTLASGSGYTNGNYIVSLTGGTGTGATAAVGISSGSVGTFQIKNVGAGYLVSDVLSASGIGAGTGFSFTITSVKKPATGLLVYDTDSLCLFHYNGSAWESLCRTGSGGTPVTQQIAFDNSVTAADNPTIDLNGNGFTIRENGSANILFFNPPTGELEIGLYDATSPTNKFRMTGDANSGQSSTQISLNYNDGEQIAKLEGQADVTGSSWVYTADTHIFNIDSLLKVTDGTTDLLSLDAKAHLSAMTASDGIGTSLLNLISDPIGGYSFNLAVSDGVNTASITTDAGLAEKLIISAQQVGISGGFIITYESQFGTGPYSVLPDDYTIDWTSGTATINLLDASLYGGKILVIKNSGVGVITIAAAGGQTIDGSATKVLATLESVMIQSTGTTNWIIISKN